MNAEELTQAQLIKIGVRIFQKACFESSRRQHGNGNWWWHGKTCEGGGAYLVHNLPQDKMTPSYVAQQVQHRGYLREERRLRAQHKLDFENAALKAYKITE